MGALLLLGACAASPQLAGEAGLTPPAAAPKRVLFAMLTEIRSPLTASEFANDNEAVMRAAVFTGSIATHGAALFHRINDYLDNPTFPVNRSTVPQFAPIGELEASTPFIENGRSVRYFGTAVIVSPCYILTDAHVVLGRDMVPVPGRDYSMTFRAGVGKVAPFAGSTMAKLVLSSERGWDGGNDWALMKLNSCVGKRAEFGWFEPALRTSQQLVGKKAISAGFAGRDGRGQISVSRGEIKSVNAINGNMRYSGSMANGQSGGPVLIVEGNSLKLAGLLTFANLGFEKARIITTFETYSEPRANEIQNAGAILNRPEVKAILDADKGGLENPAKEQMTRSLETIFF